MSVRIPSECKSYNLVCAQNPEGEILLGRKTRGYGTGRLVLPGGKVSEVEKLPFPVLDLLSYDASRELGEEAGIDIPLQKLRPAGALYIGNPLARMVTLHCCETEGQLPIDSDEVTDWAYYQEVPFSDTPEDYQLWLPAVRAGKFVTAHLTETERHVQAIG